MIAYHLRPAPPPFCAVCVDNVAVEQDLINGRWYNVCAGCSAFGRDDDDKPRIGHVSGHAIVEHILRFGGEGVTMTELADGLEIGRQGRQNRRRRNGLAVTVYRLVKAGRVVVVSGQQNSRRYRAVR